MRKWFIFNNELNLTKNIIILFKESKINRLFLIVMKDLNGESPLSSLIEGG